MFMYVLCFHILPFEVDGNFRLGGHGTCTWPALCQAAVVGCSFAGSVTCVISSSPVEKQGLLGGFEPPLRKIIGQLG